jgi:hypothetical protein
LSRVEDPEDNSARGAGATQPPSPFDSPSEPSAHESSVHESSVHESLAGESSAQESSAPDPSIHELLQSTREALARESEQSRTPFGVSIRAIAAVAVSAVVALLLVILISGLRRSDTASTFLEDVQQFKAALSSQSKDREKPDQQAQDLEKQDRQQQDQPPSKEPAKPTTEQFQRLFAQSSKPAAPPDRDTPDNLLQRFMQWRQKTGTAENAQ